VPPFHHPGPGQTFKFFALLGSQFLCDCQMKLLQFPTDSFLAVSHDSLDAGVLLRSQIQLAVHPLKQFPVASRERRGNDLFRTLLRVVITKC